MSNISHHRKWTSSDIPEAVPLPLHPQVVHGNDGNWRRSLLYESPNDCFKH